MYDIIDFALNHKVFACISLLLNFFILKPLVYKVTFYSNSHILQAKNARIRDSPRYKDVVEKVKTSINSYEKKFDKKGYLTKVRDKLKKAGYYSEYACYPFLTFKYVLPLILFGLVSLRIHDIYSIVPCCLLSLLVEFLIHRKAKALEIKFKLNAYKLYMYLHNQVTSGVNTQDAISTMYLVIDDKDIRNILMNVSAVFSLSKDVNKALIELETFNIHELNTLAIAIKHGIESGNNREILQDQEESMFDNYFDYVQSKTDSRRYLSILAAFFFSIIILIMFSIPMLKDVQNVRNVIFFN